MPLPPLPPLRHHPRRTANATMQPAIPSPAASSLRAATCASGMCSSMSSIFCQRLATSSVTASRAVQARQLQLGRGLSGAKLRVRRAVAFCDRKLIPSCHALPAVLHSQKRQYPRKEPRTCTLGATHVPAASLQASRWAGREGEDRPVRQVCVCPGSPVARRANQRANLHARRVVAQVPHTPQQVHV